MTEDEVGCCQVGAEKSFAVLVNPSGRPDLTCSGTGFSGRRAAPPSFPTAICCRTATIVEGEPKSPSISEHESCGENPILDKMSCKTAEFAPIVMYTRQRCFCSRHTAILVSISSEKLAFILSSEQPSYPMTELNRSHPNWGSTSSCPRHDGCCYDRGVVEVQHTASVFRTSSISCENLH